MDIHRCRFIPYQPHSINALAFSHPPAPDIAGRGPPNLRLAIGRANGNIELWNPLEGDWAQECVLRGGKDRTIEGLAWIQDHGIEESSGGRQPGRFRLFSIGYSALVTEWDLETAAPARHANSNFGEIWCLSAQPRWKPQLAERSSISETESTPRGQCLAAGCADGTIVLFSTEEGDLQFLKTIGRPPTKRPRILSITWKDSNTIVAGYADSTIRVFDIRNKSTVRNMTLGKGPDGTNDTIIWCVKCLPDGSIISGDSSGELKIWDSKNYSLVQRVRAHNADILDFAINGEGNTIVTGGADRRTTVLHLMGNKNSKTRRRWAQMKHRRFHQHDVKALAVFESKELSVCVSGGLDTVPIIMPLREWQNEYHRSLSHLPQSPQISSAPAARLFAAWWDREIYIWQMQSLEQMVESDSFRDTSDLIAQIRLADAANISSVQLSVDGKLLAVSTSESVKLFHLKRRRKGSLDHFHLRKVDLLSSIGKDGASVVALSPDNQWLCVVRCESEISLLRIMNDSLNQAFYLNGQIIELNRVTRAKESHRAKFGSFGNYERVLSKVAFSSDSRALAVGDISGHVDTWILEGQLDNDLKRMPFVNGIRRSRSNSESSAEDSDDTEDEASRPILGQRWSRTGAKGLPSAGVPLLLLSFHPSRPRSSPEITNGDHSPTRQSQPSNLAGRPSNVETLVVVTSQHQILEFNIISGKLSDWSRRNPRSCLPYEFRQLKDRTTGGFWDLTAKADRLWLYGPNWLFMFDLSQDLGDIDFTSQVPNGTTRSPDTPLGKRKREENPAGKLTRNTGAGDPVRDSERHSRLDQKTKTHNNLGKHSESDDLLHLSAPTLDNTDNDGVESDLALARLRRQADDADVSTKTSLPQISTRVDGYERNDARGPDGVPSNWKTPSFWHTYSYRSIFGVVPISGSVPLQSCGEIQNAQSRWLSKPNTEVVLVERPEWDMELPPRYDDGRDWMT